jgi:hypothetical protein
LWFASEKQKKPELGQQEDEFINNQFEFIQKQFNERKNEFWLSQEKKRNINAVTGAFDAWKDSLDKEMISLKKENKLKPFEDFWKEKLTEFEGQLIGENTRANLSVFFEESFRSVMVESDEETIKTWKTLEASDKFKQYRDGGKKQ